MDNIDLRILRCLKENARCKATEISKEINLSVSAVTERISRLEKSGIIQKYSLTLDEHQLGYGIEAYMEVALEHLRYYDMFTAKVASVPNIVSCYSVNGDFDFMLKIVTNSTEGLEQLHRDIMNTEGIRTTKTYFVIHRVKDETALIPEDHKR